MTLTLRRQRRRKPIAKVAPLAADARDTALRYAETTREWAAPRAHAAKDWAAPKVEPAVEKVKDDVVPAVVGAVTAALAASEPVRHEAATRGGAALAALKGEVKRPKPKKRRLRKLFLLASVLGAAYAGWKAYLAQQSRDSGNPVDAWRTPSSTPSYTPAGASGTGASGTGTTTPSTTSSATPLAPVDRPTTDDPGGAGPDEAIADAADEAAGGTSTTTVEPVTPSQAKKTSEAAKEAKDAKPTTKKTSSTKN